MADNKDVTSIEEVMKIADTLKPSDKVAKKVEVNELGDEDLNDVSGGFWKNKGYSKGYWIECPSCGASFDATKNKNCPYCGNQYEITTDDWALVELK